VFRNNPFSLGIKKAALFFFLFFSGDGADSPLRDTRSMTRICTVFTVKRTQLISVFTGLGAAAILLL
jgi:hypothetical protein